MNRKNRFVIMLTERERATIEALARMEKLPASTLARRTMLTQAESRGIVTVPEQKSSGGKVVEARPAAAQ